MAKAKSAGAKKAAPAAKPETPAPAQPDEAVIALVIAEIVLLCEAIDEQIGKRKREMYWSNPGGALGKLRDKYETLVDELAIAINPPVTSKYSSGWVDQRPARDRLDKELLVQDNGTSWARPSRFLIWASYVPLLCEWPGLGSAHSIAISAVDPKLPWLTKTGTDYLNLPEIEPRDKTPVDVARRVLAEKIADVRFDLFDLPHAAAEQLAQELETPENAWIAAAIKAGRPLDALPIPMRYQSVPQRLNIVLAA